MHFLKIYFSRFFIWFFIIIHTCRQLSGQSLISIPDAHLPLQMVINPSLQWTTSVDVPESQGMPFQLSFDRLSDGIPFYIWSSYRDGGEKLYITNYKNGLRSRSLLLSAGKGIYFQPLLLLTGENSGWAFWQGRNNHNWEIVARQLLKGKWGAIKQISTSNQEALFPAAVTFGQGVAVAWESHSRDSQFIETRIWNGSEWGECERISQPDRFSYRPAVTVTSEGDLWIVWDSYEGSGYSVYGRRLRPEKGKIEQISVPESGRSNLKPVLLYGQNTGLICAWISVIDITGGKGVIDKWNTIRAASRKEGEWETSTINKDYTIADLRHSNLSSIDPPGPINGYSGRRRHPMLVESKGDIWLLWERKIEHEGPASMPGELCGRKYDGVNWSEPSRLHSGYVNYHIPSAGKAKGSILTITALNTQHLYYSFNISLENPEKLKNTGLTGWIPLRLPLNDETVRKSISINDEKYFLYWGDLHCHTILTPDAEGEVDELMHFARDKAKIDVVVMQENDAASWLNRSPQGSFQGETLAESAYRLSVYFSRKYTEKGRFIALPGWEWSDVTDNGFPNHRTVIFAGDKTPILRHTENRGNFAELCDAVEAAGGLMNTQHNQFLLTDHPADANIEVITGWGNYLDPPEKIHADLSRGHKVGFVGTSDGHRLNPGFGGGLTGIYAKELSPEAIFDAIRSHRIYATSGNRMFIDSRANGSFMGQDFTSEGPVELTLKVNTTRPLVKAVLIRDGKQIYSLEGEGRSVLDARFTDTPGKGYHWYYWEIRQEGVWPDYPANMKVADGPMGWSSPHRVEIK